MAFVDLREGTLDQNGQVSTIRPRLFVSRPVATLISPCRSWLKWCMSCVRKLWWDGYGLRHKDLEQVIWGQILLATDVGPHWTYVHSSRSSGAFGLSTGVHGSFVTMAVLLHTITSWLAFLIGAKSEGKMPIEFTTSSALGHGLASAALSYCCPVKATVETHSFSRTKKPMKSILTGPRTAVCGCLVSQDWSGMIGLGGE